MVSLNETLKGRWGTSSGETLQRRWGVSGLRRLSGDTHKHRTVGVRRGPLHHSPICAQGHKMRVIANWRDPSLRHELRVCRIYEVIIREAAAAVVGQQIGGRDDACGRIGSQTVSIHGRQVGFAAMAIAVFESERAGVERQRVELQRTGGGGGLKWRLDRLLAVSRRAFFGLRAEVRTFVVPLLLCCLQQLNNTLKSRISVKHGSKPRTYTRVLRTTLLQPNKSILDLLLDCKAPALGEWVTILWIWPPGPAVAVAQSE